MYADWTWLVWLVGMWGRTNEYDVWFASGPCCGLSATDCTVPSVSRVTSTASYRSCARAGMDRFPCTSRQAGHVPPCPRSQRVQVSATGMVSHGRICIVGTEYRGIG